MVGLKAKLIKAMDLIGEVVDALPGESPDLPVPIDQLVWGNGNLWKPESDSDRKAVILLRDDWPKPSAVAVLRDDGVWEEFRYTGSDVNGNRHHFRGSEPGKGYKGPNNGGGVNVFWEVGPSEDDVVSGFIDFPGPPKNRHGG